MVSQIENIIKNTTMKKVLITGANKDIGFEVPGNLQNLAILADIKLFRSAGNNHHLINLTCV